MPQNVKQSTRPLAVLDFETDPFLADRVPRPFAVEFYSDAKTFVHWGTDCVEKLIKFLEAETTDYMIYAHNGGRFDFAFLFDHMDTQRIKIINGRLVEAKLIDRHVIRDSWSILPVPLKAHDKGEIDYDKMEEAVREDHKAEILDYLHLDCTSLYKMVTTFHEAFGNQLTIGGTAIKQLMELYPVERTGQTYDHSFRPWYFGGRVECFRSGVLPGPWKVYDVTSMYPHVMRSFKHPLSSTWDVGSKLPDKFDEPFFAIIEAENRAALPCLDDKGAIDFRRESGVFHVCSHELEIALRYGMVDIKRVIEVRKPVAFGSFEAFVDKFFQLRQEAKAAGDKTYDLLWKLVLNSAYGKFGQNPENYYEWHLDRGDNSPMAMEARGYECYRDMDDYSLWRKPTPIRETSYYNVAVAASITSASRSVLLEAINQADDPIYCDTDSLICREFRGDVDGKRLGSWKLECEGAPFAAIAGKKLYALTNVPEAPDSFPSPEARKAWTKAHTVHVEGKPKIATKGVRLDSADILHICHGGEVEWASPAPSVFMSTFRFVKRKVRKTVDGAA
jgi:hypothetical protein